jgi:hypothetical protein
LGSIVFGVIGILFAVFGVLGLIAPRRDLSYTERELLWMALAGIGNIVAAALLLRGFLTGL